MVIGSCRFCEALSAVCKHEDVAEIKDDILHIGGVVPTDQQLDEMANEITLLKKSSVWKVLTETMKAQALALGIRYSKDFDQLMFAKAMLHVVDLQLSTIEAISKENSRRKGEKVL